MKRRNEGVDLLRCASMLMIVVLHVMNHGGVLNAAVRGTTSYNAAWLLHCACFCAVNCYALISGYVGVKADHRFRNIIPLWLQVVFYSVLISLLLPLLIPGVAQRPLISAFFPAVHRNYWYFTAYFALFFLMPLLNKGLAAMTEAEAKRLLIGLLAVFSVLGTLPYFNIFSAFEVQDVFLLNGGSSVIWLALMYIVGGCVRLHGFGKSIRAWKLWTGFGLSVLISWCFKLYVEQDAPQALRPLLDKLALFHYPAPTMVTAALCLLLLSSRAKILPSLPGKIVRFLAPSTFSVYLIHEHNMVRAGLISGRFAPFAADSPLLLIGKALITALAIFLACCLIDQLRLLLFKGLRLRQAVDWLADRSNADAAE